MSLGREITVNTCDREGVYVAVIECSNQAPIIMETEGCDTSFSAARKRAQRMNFGGSGTVRICIAKLVPVDGNELLLLDCERLQTLKKDKNDEQ